MKVAIKNKSEWTFIDAEDLMIGTVRLADIYSQFETLNAEVNGLKHIMQTHFLVKKDNEYIIEVDGNLTLVKSLHLYEPPSKDINLKLYKVENGQLVLDKNKIGGAV